MKILANLISCSQILHGDKFPQIVKKLAASVASTIICSQRVLISHLSIFEKKFFHCLRVLAFNLKFAIEWSVDIAVGSLWMHAVASNCVLYIKQRKFVGAVDQPKLCSSGSILEAKNHLINLIRIGKENILCEFEESGPLTIKQYIFCVTGSVFLQL